MARKLREDIGEQYYHVINRANARFKIFQQDSDYELFETVLIEALKRFSIDLLTHNNLPNHFHLVVHSHKDGELARFMHWLSTTFIQRWHMRHGTTGTGHLFQGRYKSFRIKNEAHLLQVLIYVDRNTVKAGLVKKAEYWRWSAVWLKIHGDEEQKKIFARWPIEIPINYIDLVNEEKIEEDPSKNSKEGSDPLFNPNERK